MNDRNLIKQLKALKDIKPRQGWVVLTKENLFKEENKNFATVFVSFIRELQRGEKFVFNHKPAFAVAFSAVIFVGLFGFAQNSVPGDSLFSLKKITERGQAALVSERNKPKHDLEMVNKRLNDLTRVAKANGDTGKAIKEYKQTAEEAAMSIAKTEDIKEIAGEIKKIAESEKIIKSLGVEVGQMPELNNALADLVEREIKSLEKSSIPEEDLPVLMKAKQLFETERYAEALEVILQIGR